jgi:hypothetical protein
MRNQSVRLSANYLCPERRSDDGRTILEGTQTGLKSCPDLQFLVELSGLEPLTSDTELGSHARRAAANPGP